MNKIILRAVLFISVSTIVISCECSNTNGLDKAQKMEMDSIFGKLPETLGIISDYERLLSFEEKQVLQRHAKRINSETPYEVVLVTIDSIAPFEDIVTYATALGNKWSVGDEENNNGLVIMVSSALGQAAIAPGNGVEKVFTDEVTKKIIEEKMIPHFMKSDFAAGFERALLEVDKIAEGKDPVQ